MTADLRWTIDRTVVPEDLDPPPPSPEPPRARRPRRAFWARYAGLLLLALAVGFAWGRQMEVRAAAREGVQATMDLAQLAVERGDEGLLRETFDSQADPTWMEHEVFYALRGELAAGPPRVVEIRQIAPDRVVVNREDGGGQAIGALEFRKVGDRWLRTDPDPGLQGSQR